MNTDIKDQAKPTQIMEAEAALPATTDSPSGQATAMIQMIKEVALNPQVNVEAMRAILDMQRQLTKDQAERAFNSAMVTMAAELPRIKKSGKVEYLVDKTKKDGPKEEAFRFAKYEDIDKAIRPILIKNGFSLSFDTDQRPGGGLIMMGTLSHKEGHSRVSRIAVALDDSGGKNNIQGMGSSSSYGKRYVTCMLLNIITEGEDDDGNSAEPIPTEVAADIDTRLRKLSEASPGYREKFLKWAAVETPEAITRKGLKKAISELERVEKGAAKKGAA